MSFGQFVIGPPGSGKTTYCFGIQQFLGAVGRKVAIVNLDPANDRVPYTPTIDIEELITLDDVMQSLDLGPNGGMIYCIEFLEKNFKWLEDRMKSYIDQGYYFIFDCPGQVELYTHNPTIRNICHRLQKIPIQLVCVHLVDASYCTDPAKYISVLMVSLCTMMMLELPHINVLSKIDLIKQFGSELDFNLEYYTEVMDLSYLLFHLNQGDSDNKYAKLNEAVCELIEDFNLVGFTTLCIEDKESVANLVKQIDKANGYIFGGLTAGNEAIMQAANLTDSLTEARETQRRFQGDGANIHKHSLGQPTASGDVRPGIDPENLQIIEH
ncbi:hypothetical protein EV182_000034 [Spiromyces aspiralis]|uniref:Uncharacterized protein n=1 Tax=Spiromyces aspiralis TaxID=68401 RepID=A0ACC1HI44_9FUNG|nr:hypothetical protein EV182_000034 [Spiromyces aspiralis]